MESAEETKRTVRQEAERDDVFNDESIRISLDSIRVEPRLTD